jgi:hypothetical protein
LVSLGGGFDQGHDNRVVSSDGEVLSLRVLNETPS